MRPKPQFTIFSFILCVVFNGVLIGGTFYAATEILRVLHQWVDPFAAGAAADVPEDMRLAATNLTGFLSEIERYLAPVVLGGGAALTLLLWLFLQPLGRGLINRAQREGQALAPTPSKAERSAAQTEDTHRPESRYVQPYPAAAVQMLSILQREGRFIDFLQEDLSLYDDAQIGAAVRNIHEGCKGAIHQYMELKPVMEEAEGAEVTVSSGFDARAIRLTGDVAGDPPFRGLLRHRGWRVLKVQLPQPTSEQKDEWVVAPAEVEVNP